MALATQILIGILFSIIATFHFMSYGSKLKSIGIRVGFWLVEALSLTVAIMLLSHDRVESDSDLLAVELGWPLNYVVQNQLRFDPPYPWAMGWAWEVPTHFNYLNLTMNWAVFLVFVCLIHWIHLRIFRNKSNTG